MNNMTKQIKNNCKHDKVETWDCGCSFWNSCDACSKNWICLDCGSVFKEKLNTKKK